MASDGGCRSSRYAGPAMARGSSGPRDHHGERACWPGVDRTAHRGGSGRSRRRPDRDCSGRCGSRWCASARGCLRSRRRRRRCATNFGFGDVVQRHGGSEIGEGPCEHRSDGATGPGQQDAHAVHAEEVGGGREGGCGLHRGPFSWCVGDRGSPSRSGESWSVDCRRCEPRGVLRSN
jgi:hypothetical protein